MGKGDKKTKRGKIFMGSHGKLNPRKLAKVAVQPTKKKAKPKKEDK